MSYDPRLNWNRYPPNLGAVPGSRVQYTSIEAFMRDYGRHLDRIGSPRGHYLTLRPDEISPNFESRSLPVTSLKDRLHVYELAGFLPEGWIVEINEVAPYFGRNGGSLQVLVRNERGAGVPVEQLVDIGVIE